MDYENILLTRKDEYAILTVNRPSAMNALNTATFRELNQALDEIEGDAAIRGLIITGSGRSFIAGADLAEVIDQRTEENQVYVRLAQTTYSRIEALSIPVIAAINGFALGGGCELALCCDIRIASEKAKFGQPEAALGVIPAFGGTQRLPRLVGQGIAKELIFTGRHVSAGEALQIGLVNKVVVPEALMETCEELMAAILRNSSTALRYSKVAMNRGSSMTLQEGLGLEMYLSSICHGSPDKVEGVAAFLEKRSPIFRGR